MDKYLIGFTHRWLGADMDKWNVKELSVCLRGWNRFDRFFCTSRRSEGCLFHRLAQSWAGSTDFKREGLGTSERREWGMMGMSAVRERGVMGRKNPCSPFVPAFPIRKRHSKVNLRYFEFHCYDSTRLNFSTVGEFSWNWILKDLTDPSVEIKKKLVVLC